MSGVINPYDGSILFERVLKANLPTKTSGKKIFFVVNQPTDTVGEIWATNNEGTVVCYSVAVDVQTLNAAMEAFQKQLANLTETDTSLLNKINVLKEYHSLSELELNDADMSPTDFGANLVKILDAMKSYGVLRTWVYNTTPNLRSSINAEAIVKSDDYGLTIEKVANNKNIVNKVTIRPNTATGNVREQWGYYDNAWGGFREVATTTKTSFLCTAKEGFTIVAQDCFIQNNRAYIHLLVKKTNNTVFDTGTHDIVVNPKPPSIRYSASAMPHTTTGASGVSNTPVNAYIAEATIPNIGISIYSNNCKSVIIDGSYPIG